MLYIKENTTVGELKKFIAQIPDESQILTGDLYIRFDDHSPDGIIHELYIESV